MEITKDQKFLIKSIVIVITFFTIASIAWDHFIAKPRLSLIYAEEQKKITLEKEFYGNYSGNSTYSLTDVILKVDDNFLELITPSTSFKNKVKYEIYSTNTEQSTLSDNFIYTYYYFNLKYPNNLNPEYKLFTSGNYAGNYVQGEYAGDFVLNKAYFTKIYYKNTGSIGYTVTFLLGSKNESGYFKMMCELSK